MSVEKEPAKRRPLFYAHLTLTFIPMLPAFVQDSRRP